MHSGTSSACCGYSAVTSLAGGATPRCVALTGDGVTKNLGICKTSHNGAAVAFSAVMSGAGDLAQAISCSGFPPPLGCR